MGELLIKPYEISVWEDKLINGAFTENKIAVIGSNTMTGLNKVYDPVFSKKTNGEKTLSFSLRYKYFDPYSGNSDYVNPFAALLVNERKVKLHYDNQWYEFIIKDHTESSDGLEWTYTCSDAFILELSKNGYNLTFDSELNNNQGTARELAQKVLQDTDWQLGGATVGKQMVAEPIYYARLISTEGITIINASDNGEHIPQANTNIYVFYNYVKNQDGKFVQFIIRDENYTTDDNNVITDTNFRISNKLTYDAQNFCFKKGNNVIIQLILENNIPKIDNQFQAYRLVYNQLTTYDPVMGRTVDRFKISNGDREIYRYTDYIYTTSNVITNLITNGDNFNVLEDGTLQGWNPYVDFTPLHENDKIDPLELITKPELGTGKALANLSTLSQIEGFLKVSFKGALDTSDSNNYKNAIFNSGIQNNTSIIKSISKGDQFVFRWRAGTGNVNNLTATQNLGLIVAKYTQDAPTYGYYYKHFAQEDIILQTEGTPQQLNNYIDGGYIDRSGDIHAYIINGVAQTPSTKYIYKDGNTQYVWNPSTSHFDVKTNNNYLPYYYLIATATKGVANTTLTDSTENIGIFIYNTNGSGIYYIQDIQLTRYAPDTNGNPVLIGNIPTASSNAIEYYYVKPAVDTLAEDVVTYVSTDELLKYLYPNPLDRQNITVKPLYNTDSEKNLIISASKSNCFNILQTIAETFECWIDLVVEHESNGAISIINGIPQKFVYLREYAGKDNYAGFKYGINLNSIERTINSDEVVTKLIVDQSQSDYVDEGFVSIANAASNTSGESYILNFDYYYNQNLLNREVVEADKNAFITTIAQQNNLLRKKEKQRRDLEASLTELESKRNVYTELVETAKDTLTRALNEFERLTGLSYEEYQSIHTFLEEADQFTEEDTICDLIGEIYVSSATINNYSGLLTNIEQEYWQVRTQLRGSETYQVKVWVGKDDLRQRHIFVEVSDYLVGLGFAIENRTETVTVSKKYFDIESTAHVITFTAPEGYLIGSFQEQAFTINDNRVLTFRVSSLTSTTGIEDEIEDIYTEKDILTKNFNNKYSRFIQEGTWSSTDYIDSELYYLDALQVSNTSAQPTVSYTISVVEISELEDYKWYNFDTGDKTYVEDTEFFGWASVNGNLTPAREEVIVSEVEWHLDEPENNVITVQNYKTRFEDLFQRISATVQTVQYNEATYAKTSTLLDANGTINQNVLLESLNRISGQEYNLTSDGSIMIHGDEILIQNLTNTANCVILNSEGIRISSDGGQTWKTAIDGQGINIGAVYTGTLNTQNVIIGSEENPSFRWDKAGISAYEIDQNNQVSNLKTYVRYDQYGLYGIKNHASFKAQSLQDVKDHAHFAVTWDGFFIRNNYTDGRVEITSDNDFQVIQTINGVDKERIKIGALEFNQLGQPTLYGIRIKTNDGVETFKTGSDGNITITGTIYANAGEIGGMVVNNDTLTMDTIVLEPGVGIYSTVTSNENPMFSISDVDGSAIFRYVEALGGKLGNLSVIDTITVGDGSSNGVIQSYNYIQNFSGWKIDSTGYAEFSNARVRGHIEAETGDFTGWVAVGDRTQNALTNPWIVISGGVTNAASEAYGSKAIIKTSNYSDGASYGWMINSDGDAVFNNITARGAIKTAVFEYAEIQAVGGLFIFRPSSTIRGARISGNNLILKVEKPLLFCKVSYILSEDTQVNNSKTYYRRTNYSYEVVNNPTGNPHDQNYYEKTTQFQSWCKISNYTTDGSEPDVQNVLLTNGLTHVYQISQVNLETAEITLTNGIAFVNAVRQQGQTDADVLAGLEGGALIDMGRSDGTSNYGIGVNSSDNTVNLPRRAISLFETVINENANPKVTYNYRGILGTLPELSVDKVSRTYSNYLAGTQGIYTDNMYIGDNHQYIAFFTDTSDPSNPKKRLKINAKEIIYGLDENDNEITWDEHIDEQIPIRVEIISSAGELFVREDIRSTLICHVYKGTDEITNQVTRFTWSKYIINSNGIKEKDETWVRLPGGQQITIGPEDVASKAIFECEVEF